MSLKIMKVCSLIFVMLCLLISCNQISIKEKETTFLSVNNIEINKQSFIKKVNHIADSAKVAGFSFVLIKDGKIAYEYNYGFENVIKRTPITKNTVYEVASLSKPVFSYFVLKQQEKQFIDLDTLAYEYLPLKGLEYDLRYKLITSRMLLNHTSGLPNWRRETNDSLKLFFNPGEKYNYSGEGYQYLKDILAHQLKVNDRGLDSIFQNEICNPMNIDNMSFVWNKNLEANKAYGHINYKPTDNSYQRNPDLFGSAFSLHSTAKDYAKFIIGVMNKNQLSLESWEELMMTPKDSVSKRLKNKRNLAFNIQESKEGYQILQHKGSNGDFKSLVRFYPHNNYGVLILSNSDNLYKSGLINYILTTIKS